MLFLFSTLFRAFAWPIAITIKSGVRQYPLTAWERTWLQILQEGKHGSGSEKIPRRQMKVAVPQHISEDQEFFTVVRFFGKCPMIGYVDRGVYFIVWLDRRHECY